MSHIEVPRLKAGVWLSSFDETISAPRRLVQIDGASFAVSETIYEVLRALRAEPVSFADLCARLAGTKIKSPEQVREILASAIPAVLLEGGPAPQRRSPFSVRLTLVSEGTVDRISRRLFWLFTKPAAAIILATFAIVVGLALPGMTRVIDVETSWAEWATVYILLIASSLCHELGHAAACARYGAPPGSIGVALYVVYPVFYTDVTRAWRLSSRERAVVDVSGLYLQILPTTVVGVYAIISQSPVALHYLTLSVMMMVFTLNPVFKTDGYWLLSDLAGIANLHQRVVGALRDWLAAVRGGSLPTPVTKGSGRNVVYPFVGLFTLYAVVVTGALLLSLHRARAALGAGSVAVPPLDVLTILAKPAFVVVLAALLVKRTLTIFDVPLARPAHAAELERK